MWPGFFPSRSPLSLTQFTNLPTCTPRPGPCAVPCPAWEQMAPRSRLGKTGMCDFFEGNFIGDTKSKARRKRVLGPWRMSKAGPRAVLPPRRVKGGHVQPRLRLLILGRDALPAPRCWPHTCPDMVQVGPGRKTSAPFLTWGSELKAILPARPQPASAEAPGAPPPAGAPRLGSWLGVSCPYP